MASLLGRFAARLATPVARAQSTQAGASTTSSTWRAAMGLCGTVAVGSGAALAYGEMLPILAEEEFVHPPHQLWNHLGYTETFDHASIRRGYEVYKQVCAACHSMDRIAFRNMVDVIYTEAEVKQIAAEYDVVNKEPNDNGETFTRPGKLFDYFPPPYPNEEASRKANGGALPPDLSVIVKARHGNEDYIFSLLTGYCDAPAGVNIPEDKYFNPYFPGGAISMAPPLYDEIIEYTDGTPASQSQLAKDVSTFLAWTAEPEHDDRKRMGLKAIVVLSLSTMFLLYIKRHKWSTLKSRQVLYKGSR
eukprot:m.332880 g.332880  ORF g.332880 m.332880 type:complete len:304 (-) comp17020_c0_seq1:150-1061(-)